VSRILVTPRSVTAAGGHPSLQALVDAGYEVVYSAAGKQPSEAELIALLPGCVGYLAGVEPITERALSAADALRVISRNGTGVDSVDLKAAEARGIRVCRAEGANARGVAELTIGLMLALVRAIPLNDAALKAGGWERRKGVELTGRTLGLVGCGRIGRYVAECALGLGMKALAYDLYPDAAYSPGAGFAYAGLDEVIARADVLSLHCPPAERPLIDADAIAAMKPGVYVINTARHGLIDDDAALAALESGRIAGLALDVYGKEPPEDRRLASHPRVVATAHIGGFTSESVDRAMSAAVDNLLEALRA